MIGFANESSILMKDRLTYFILFRLLGEKLLAKQFRNDEYENFSDVIKAFLDEAALPKPPIAACFAVAGPVRDNVVRFTNRISWTIDGDAISDDLGIPKVILINDFLANGYGILTLDEGTECVKLQDAPKRKEAPIAVIGAGTGLG